MGDLISALGNFGGRQPQLAARSYEDKELPRFGGEPEQWMQFSAEFIRTTNKYHLDDSENMMRLRKALFGIAKNTVYHLMANTGNVNTIMYTLEKRFGQPRHVLNALAQRTKNCNNVTTMRPETIVEFGIAVQSLVANIVAYGEEAYLNNVELLDTLVKKLSHDLATKWYEWLSSKSIRYGNLKNFAHWIDTQMDIAYQRVDLKVDEKDDQAERRRRWSGGSINAMTAKGDRCLVCGKPPNHSIEKCFEFNKKSVTDRWAVVKKSRLCVSCLRPGHRAKDCKQLKKCSVEMCTHDHHILLHPNEEVLTQEITPDICQEPPVMEIRDGNYTITQGNIAIIKGCDGPLPIIPVNLKTPNGNVNSHALLDTGASRSIMTKQLATKLNLYGPRIVYSYNGVTGDTVTDRNAQIVNCAISGTFRDSPTQPLNGVVTVEEIRMNPYSINMEKIRETWSHMKAVTCPNLCYVVPELIIGNNNFHLIMPRKMISRGVDEPMAWRSVLGWTVAGNLYGTHNGTFNVLVGSSPSNEELHTLIKSSFSFEDFGVRTQSKTARNLDEKRALEILQHTTKKNDDGWETGLLWKSDDTHFPESEKAAFRRLLFTERKCKDPKYFQFYKDKFQELTDKGYIRKLTQEEKMTTTPKTFVISHFGHTNPNKPGKFRFILDAKAEANGKSLNSQLLKGPDLIRSLVGIIWNFRRHPIALTGDIADMFHRIKIREEDQDSQRFLWRDCDSSRPADHYKMLVMIFGATSSPASAIFVKNTNAQQFKDKFPKAVEVTLSDFYVDDLLSGGKDPQEVIKLRAELSEIHANGNFKLCKWMSNSIEVLQSIPNDLRAEGAKDFAEKDDLPGERILGLWWNANDDTFQFKLGLHKVDKKILDGGVPTKRQMCGVIMSVYDPIGFIIPFKVKGLMLLQEVWRHGIGWDDQVQEDTFSKWKEWIARLDEIKQVKVPRCYSPLLPDADNVQLHTFVDASSEAMCAVSYLRVQRGGNVAVTLVNAKARVAPIKKTTIPRMELQAALLGARMVTAIEHELRITINKKTFWTDSTTVWFWLHSRGGKLREFEANRVGEIQEITEPSDWNWIPTNLNIADIGTRFAAQFSFQPNEPWFTGPSFLYQAPDTWNFREEKENKNKIQLGSITALSGYEDKVSITSNLRSTVPDPEKFSSYIRLVRATAAVNIAAQFWIQKVRNRKQLSSTPWSTPVQLKASSRKLFVSHMEPADIHAAELKLIKLAQEEEFGDPEKAVRKNGNSKLWKLSAIVEAGFVRMDGRLRNAHDSCGISNNPLVLPPRHHVTRLIIDFEHRRNAHQGLETVLSNIQKKFWLVDGRNAVKRIFRECQLCKIRRAKPLEPKMGSIPDFRLKPYEPPFTYAGVDLFGPIEVTVGRHHEKRWGVLFCCMVMRAIHLEVVYALSTDEFIMALSRFVSTRGRPNQIVSDNGTNFVGARKLLSEEWNSIDFAKVQECGDFQEIKWKFNPPAAPHMGGCWERMIQTVKKCLKVVLHEKFPKDTTLLTMLKSVENIVNSRPLTHQSEDPTDPQAITPNHLLRGSCDAGPPVPAEVEPDQCLRSMWKRSVVLQDQFWKLWTKQYLPQLLRRSKWTAETEPLEVGSLVFIVDDQLPSNCWSRGFVSSIHPGKDNQIRVVDVTVKDRGNGKSTVFRRPVSRTAPLGLKMEIKTSNQS